jgi:hypothetical protein
VAAAEAGTQIAASNPPAFLPEFIWLRGARDTIPESCAEAFERPQVSSRKACRVR